MPFERTTASDLRSDGHERDRGKCVCFGTGSLAPRKPLTQIGFRSAAGRRRPGQEPAPCRRALSISPGSTTHETPRRGNQITSGGEARTPAQARVLCNGGAPSLLVVRPSATALAFCAQELRKPTSADAGVSAKFITIEQPTGEYSALERRFLLMKTTLPRPTISAPNASFDAPREQPLSRHVTQLSRVA